MSGYHRVEVVTYLEKLVVAVIISAVFFPIAILLVFTVVLFASIFAAIIVVALVTVAAVVLLVVAAVAVAVISNIVAVAALRFEVERRIRSFLFNSPNCQGSLSNRPPQRIFVAALLIVLLEPNRRLASKVIVPMLQLCAAKTRTHRRMSASTTATRTSLAT